MANARHDENSRFVIMGESSAGDGTLVAAYVDPVTHRVLVSTASGSTTNVDAETPSGTINGSNLTFTLANTPSPSSSLQLYLNGALQQATGGDYTLVTATITFVIPPPAGSILLAWYRK